MANQELYNKQYKIPTDIINNIRAAIVSNSNGKGIKRANFMVNNGYLTYQAMKRLKNFFDYFNPQTDTDQFALAGGQEMKGFIEKTLNADRNAVNTSKDVRRDMTPNLSSELKPYQSPRLNEEKKKKNKNAIAIIVNNDNKILLLKRGKNESWMPNKWSFVGGNIGKGETPQKAIEREILEETGLKINNFIKSFSIERTGNSIEYIFTCRYNGEPIDIELDTSENISYGWYDRSEIMYLDIVPHLMEYITLVFKKYN